MKKRFAMLLMLLVPVFAKGSQVVVTPQEPTSLTVNMEVGSIVQLPSSVKTITPSRFFAISDLGAEIDKSTGQKTDVRTFQIKPVSAARSETVTFLLANGQSLKLRLSPGRDAETFIELKLPPDSGKPREQRFLTPEISMLRAMIKDEAQGFGRKIVIESVSIPKLDDLKVKLVRVYKSQDLAGFVFVVSNYSKSPVTLNPAALWVGKPNRAILAQADKYSLSSCTIEQTVECSTVFRIVARSESSTDLALNVNASSISPFVKLGNETEISGGVQ